MSLVVALSPAVTVSQQQGRADSVKNCSRGTPRSTGAEHKQSFPRPSSDVRYKSGSFQFKEGKWLRGAFVPEEAAHRTVSTATISVDQLRETLKQTDPILIITLDQLRAFYSDPRAEKDSDLVQRIPRSGCGYAKSLMPKSDSAPRPEALVAWVSSPGPVSRAMEHLNTRPAVRLLIAA